jgi:hypothetical protein
MMDTSSDETTSMEDEMTEYNIDNITYDEYYFQDDEKVHLEYCIGVFHTENDGELILGTSISASSLLNYDMKYVLGYLEDDTKPVYIDIMQVHIAEDFTYNVVLKTFWLRIVQRTWRKIFRQRQKIIQIRKLVSSQLYFSMNGKYPLSASYLPQYSGIIR